MEPTWSKSNTEALIFLIVFLISLWLHWLWTRRDLYRFALKFPGGWGLPIFGNFHRIKAIENILPEIGKGFEECDCYTISIWMGLYPTLLTADPEMVQQILSSPDLLNKSVIYQPLQNMFGGGLVGSKAEKWQQHRKLINPSFSHSVLLSFLPIFQKGKNKALSKFESLVDGSEHKIYKILQRISLEGAVETTMGKIMTDDIIDDDLCTKYTFVLEKLSIEALLTCLHLEKCFLIYRRFAKAIKTLHIFVDQLIKKKLALKYNTECPTEYKTKDYNKTLDETTEELNAASQESVMTMKKNPNIFIDQAIELYQKQKITWRDIIAESNTLVGAAFDTTATAMCSVIVMLAMHSDIQERLFAEIVDIFPDKDFEISYEHLKQLPYLDRVINETLRLVPSVAFIGRQAFKDIQLTKDLKLPKGFQILISIFHLHRRIDIWGPKALKFDPDHFLPESLSGKHSHAFIPFSKGSRNCIGWRYALIAMKTQLCGLVRNFRFTTNVKFEDLRYVQNVTINFLKEPDIRIHRR